MEHLTRIGQGRLEDVAVGNSRHRHRRSVVTVLLLLLLLLWLKLLLLLVHSHWRLSVIDSIGRHDVGRRFAVETVIGFHHGFNAQRGSSSRNDHTVASFVVLFVLAIFDLGIQINPIDSMKNTLMYRLQLSHQPTL